MTPKEILFQQLNNADDQLIVETINWLRSRQESPTEATPETWLNVRTLPTFSAPSWDTTLQKLETPAHPQALATLLQSWEDEDNTQEQQETWEYLRQALDQDRLSDRPLYS
jgi:hypothetical protein